MKCNLNLVTLMAPEKLSLNRIMSLNGMVFCEIVNKFNVTKLRLYCRKYQWNHPVIGVFVWSQP